MGLQCDMSSTAHELTIKDLEFGIVDIESMIALKYGWDDGEQYTISEKACDSALILLRAIIQFARRHKLVLPHLVITPCRDGSIDFYWRRWVLVNLDDSITDSASESECLTGDEYVLFHFIKTFIERKENAKKS